MLAGKPTYAAEEFTSDALGSYGRRTFLFQNGKVCHWPSG